MQTLLANNNKADSVSLRFLDYASLVDPRKVLRGPFLQATISSFSAFSNNNNPYEGRKIPKKFKGYIVLVYAVIPKDSPWLQGQKPEPNDSMFTPFVCKIQAVNFKDYLEHKGNQNKSITGSSQHGKSFLNKKFNDPAFDDQPKIIFSFKPGDHALKMKGFEIRDAREHMPPIFADDVAFAEAYKATFFDERTSTGIQLQQTTSLLKELAKEAQNSTTKDWNAFFAVCDKRRNDKKRTTRNQQEALATIEQNCREIAQELVSFSKSKPLDFGKSIVVDFASIRSDIGQKFCSELLCTQLWHDVETGKRINVSIEIDEARRITTNPYSMIHTLSKEIGYRGRVSFITQNLKDINAKSSTSIATKICFRAGNEDQLLYQHLPMLHDTLTRLRPFQFIDLEFPRIHEYIPVFQYVPSDEELANLPTAQERAAGQSPKNHGGGKQPENEAAFKKELRKEKDVEESREKSRERESPEGEGNQRGEKKRDRPRIDEEEIYAMLPSYDWPIEQEYFKKHSSCTQDKVKLAVTETFNRLRKAGRVGSAWIEEFPEQTYFAFHYPKKESEGKNNLTRLHSYMQASAATAIRQLTSIGHCSISGEKSNPDIETENLDIEIETGKANRNLKRLEARLTATLEDSKKSNKSIIIIVPSEEEAGAYTRQLLRYLMGYPNRMSIMTLKELRKWVAQVKMKGDDALNAESQWFLNMQLGKTSESKTNQI